MSNVQPQLSIVIVSYRDATSLSRCLASIAQFGGLGSVIREVIVVKNSDEVLDATVLPDQYLTLIQNDKNVGFGAAVNQAAWLARGSHMVLLNPDSQLRADSVPQLLSFLREHEDAAIIGLRQESSNGQLVASFGNQPNVLREVVALTGLSRVLPVGRLVRPRGLLRRCYSSSGKRGWVGGGAACINLQVFKSFGGFDERYFMYVEDVDLCRRIGRAGGQVWYCSTAAVTHDDGAARARPRQRVEAQRHTTEGLLRYAEAYGHAVAPLRIVQQLKQLVRA